MVLTAADGSEESFTFFPVLRTEDAHLIVQRNYDGVYVKVAKKFDSTTELRGFCVSMERHDREFESVQIKQKPSDEPSECRPHSRTSHQDGEENPFVSKKCPNCSVCFRNLKNLEAHQKYYCTGRDRNSLATAQHDQGTCKRLDVSRSSSPSLPSRSSSRTSADAIDNPFVHVCQLCQSSFTSRQNCESHMLILHCSEHVAMCKFCNFVAQSWDILREHVFSHVKMERRSEEEAADNQHISCHECDAHAGQSEEDHTSEEEAVTHPSLHRIPLNGVQREFIQSPGGQKIPAQVSSRHHDDPQELSHDSRHLKRQSDAAQLGAKRARMECSSPSTHPHVEESNFPQRSVVEIPLGDLAHHSGGHTLYTGELGPLPALAATVCTACNICFRSKANFMAHKKYYCKERHSENKDGISESNARRDLPTYLSPRETESPGLHNEENGHDLGKESAKSRDSPPGAEGPRVMKPPPVMYMSPVVPSAMLVGGTQLISPTGAHVISPIFLLTPPVAIPVTSVEASQSSLPSESRLKRTGKDDSPLDLSVRSSTASPEEDRRVSPLLSHDAIIRKEVIRDPENIEQESPSTSKKSFSCSYCGVTFWKAKTLIAHRQFYCSKISKNVSTLPSSSSHYTESSLNHLKTSPRDGDSVKLETPLRYTSPENSPPSISKGAEFRNHSHPDLKKPPANISREKSHQEYHIHERQGKPMYLHQTLIHHSHGLHHCSGCGVAFRKMESLEIHQKFYCQKSKPVASSTASSHFPVTHKKLNGHWKNRLQQSNNLGAGKSRPDKLESHQSQDSIPTTSGYSLKNIQSDLRYADSLTRSKPTEMNTKHSMKWNKYRRESSSPVLGGERGGYPWSSRDHERLRARSWPSSVGKVSFTRCFQNLSMENSLARSYGHIPKLLSVKSKPSDWTHCQRDSQNCGKKQEVDSNPDKVEIKVEEDSQPCSEAEDFPNKSKQDKAQAPIDGKSRVVDAHFSQGIRQADTSFPPGSKACRSCNISFQSLSTFIAHKKYYCSAATNQKSKVTT
ncbi:Zinc finger protein ZFPM1 [Holothuria leucospilota]|uniref:Zinc finger protein ZFPM1 n=1 Tax=Holothuria leucospilota TaxID=206669 RepID=A0A9Q1HD84_HOLLE|nr:Zinc finger protein ZFPM1 [Holothuria leucospilota]